MKPYFDDGTVTLYHGDARDVLPHLDVKVDLLVTDPPYGISTDGAGARGPRKDRRRDFGDADLDLDQARELVREVDRLLGPMMTRECSAYWWTSDVLFGTIVDVYRSLTWSTRNYVWEKVGHPPPMPCCCWTLHELCVHAYPEGRTWTHGIDNPPPPSVIRARAPRRSKWDHPNEKPIAVIEPLIRASSLPGQLVIDPCAGSGTTLVTARMMGRRAIGIEKSERWAERAALRLSQGVLDIAEGAA